MADFTIKRNDLLPILEAILRDANENPVDLTDATGVVFHMREEAGAAMKITDGLAAIGSNPAAGQVSYAWQTDETDTSGIFLAEFEVTWTGGKIQTYPSKGYISVEVVDDLA